ncbi:1,5-anhydro-D-fructose reductase [Planctomycetes bacterium Pan216]|uniref:1,5-anhydro-D-fructose reductase n=1 Tax=Kolteria novifilia TaxID=2527975 RepID=A0A518B6G5_9BACT|nr:1,5-anhydro-D-fructose reductase [Planctomycetes bacterium Pan216]
MAKVGFGIVGCGMIAKFHARAIDDLRGAQLRGVVTSNPDKATAMLEESYPHAVDIHTDLDEMLARDDIDVINICTPSGAHLDPAVKAAKAGKHVVVEKPLEITLKRCDKIINACRDAGVLLCTIFPSRFSDVNQELRKAIDKGRFGNLTLGETTVKWWRPQSYYDSGGWRGTWQLDGGGALMNQAIHNVDLLYSMMGDVAQVGAFTSLLAHERIEVEDTAVASLRFQNGALGSILATTSVYPGLLKTIGIHGDKGSAVVEQDDLLTWTFAKEQKRDATIRENFGKKSGATGGASDPGAISHTGHARQLADFVKAITKGTTPLVDGEEGRKAVEIILAIYQSQATGKIVKLPLARDPKPPMLAS